MRQVIMNLFDFLPLNIKKPIFYQLSHEDIEVRRKIITIYLFSSIGFLFLF